MQALIIAPPIRLHGDSALGAWLRRPVVGILVFAMAVGFQPQRAEAGGFGYGGLAAGLVVGALLGGMMSHRAHAHGYAPRRATRQAVAHHAKPVAVAHHKGKNRTRDAEPETTNASVNTGDTRTTPSAALSGVNVAPANDMLNKGNLAVAPPDSGATRALPPVGNVTAPVKAPPEAVVGAAPPPVGVNPSPAPVAPAPVASAVPAPAPSAAPTPGSGDLH